MALNGRFLSKLDTYEANDTQGSSYSFVHYPGYQMWKIVLSQRIYKAYMLQLSVDNIFNYQPKVYAANSPISPGTTFMAGISIDIDEIF